MKTILFSASMMCLLAACGPRPAEPAAPDAPQAAPANAPLAGRAPVETPAAVDGPAPPPAGSGPLQATSDPAAATANDAGTDDTAVNDAIDSNLGDHTQYQAVITRLQTSVAAHDAAAVADLADYPISVEIDGKATTLDDKAAFVARYDDFMTPEIARAIVGTAYSDLFVNYKGVMFGDGQAWITGICKDPACDAFDVKLTTLQSGP